MIALLPGHRSFSLLDAKMDMAREGDATSAAKVPEVLDRTIVACQLLAELVHESVQFGA